MFILQRILHFIRVSELHDLLLLNLKPIRELLKHLFHNHNFNIGKAENLVNIGLFIDTLRRHLESYICLYCEKEFKGRDTLKEHMRKKKHYRITSSNAKYHQFYLENYLDNDETQDMRSSEDSSGDEGSDWGEWEEDLSEVATCLFCSYEANDSREVFKHMINAHNFDFNMRRILGGMKRYFLIVTITLLTSI